jgi:RNA-directed DNA polymerase
MTVAKTTEPMSPQLLKVAERARNDRKTRLISLARLIDVPALERAYRSLRKDAAVGVDGVTKAEYGENLEENLRDLHARMKQRRYRHQPLRRVYVPKERGKKRPIGISALEDKIVQGALREVLEAVYEQDFLDCSYGFRPKRSAHDAIRALYRAVGRDEVKWVLEADIESFFDSVDRKALLKMLDSRIADGSLMRLIAKCLHVGVLDGEEYSEPDLGTPQGSVLSPILGNVYLHTALDEWFEAEVKPRLAGKALLVRYCDDFVIGFERRDDAERVMAVLGKRMARFGLRLHPDKTRLLAFGRPPKGKQKGKGSGTFDFLGFTWHWERTRQGRWRPACKTRRVRRCRAIKSVYDYCRRHRHESVQTQHRALTRRLQGHYNYFGVNGNLRSLAALRQHAARAWYKWLCRRSQRARLTWERFSDLQRDFPLPAPRITVQIWTVS